MGGRRAADIDAFTAAPDTVGAANTTRVVAPGTPAPDLMLEQLQHIVDLALDLFHAAVRTRIRATRRGLGLRPAARPSTDNREKSTTPSGAVRARRDWTPAARPARLGSDGARAGTAD